MVTRFGSREIADVTFKATVNAQKVGNKEFAAGQPVFVIDTATASSMEQATTTVYAQGGQGYNRLISWEGEKTMTFTVTDALMSPLGFAVLTGAGFATEAATKHIHVTYDVQLNGGKGQISVAELQDELGIASTENVIVCVDEGTSTQFPVKPYATVLDGNGAIIDWVDVVTLGGGTSDATNHYITLAAGSTTSTGILTVTPTLSKTEYNNSVIKVDFYVIMTTGATEITIEPGDFGGFFYVEADTLYRNQDGKDMAATITFPRVKVQSGFTLAMAPTGDPSTFDFTMDAFPAYTYFDHTKKVVCDITIVGGDTSSSGTASHITDATHGLE